MVRELALPSSRACVLVLISLRFVPPSLSLCVSTASAAEARSYVAEYAQVAKDLAAAHPERVKLVSLEKYVNDADTQASVRKFVGK